MQICLPKNVENIINTLEAAGFEAYAVGGCVRDSILGRTPNDWDITTSALPMETKALFSKTFDTGIQHGTVSVLLDHEIFEVTTFRIDGEYEDNRHPKDVSFTKKLSEDLLRRDFTINAMAYNPKSGLVDLYGGIEDIEHKTIRCVGVAKERFTEDALRILRAVRFAAQLDYFIEKETEDAILELAPTLKHISAERIQAELLKILTSDHPEWMQEAYRLGITKEILPEFDVMMQTTQNNPHHCYTVGEHAIHVLMNAPNEKCLRIAALLHDVAKPVMKTTGEDGVDHFRGHPDEGAKMASEILHRLKMDNDTIRTVSTLVRYHDRFIEEKAKSLRHAMYTIGEEYFPMLFDLNVADLMGQSEYMRKEKLEHIANLRKIYEEILAKAECVSLKTLAITGRDLIEQGYQPGPAIGEKLNELLLKVIEDPSINNKEALMKLL